MRKNIFVATAWPYANGSLHLGHVAALLGADIIARYHRLCGDNVLFVSGSDCYGTPIAVEAEKRGIKPAKIAEKYHKEFIDNLLYGLNFSYDLYSSTITKNHKKIVQDIFLKLYKNGHIYKKKQSLPYCNYCKHFLADRYIEGKCPICQADGARGDQCDECGNLLDTKQLINPRCKICGTHPEWKESEHFFLRLSSFCDKLDSWVKQSKDWRANAVKMTLSLLNKDLPDRAITRDLDWGVPVPLKGYKNKCIYVWFEAVCGYLSASKEWALTQGKPDAWENFWQNDESIHFYAHGKDNILFHTIIWPSILLGYGNLHLPDRIVSSEYLTFEKRQFSKSRNWVVLLSDFLKEFDSETLRYYLIINGPETSDADFSWAEYERKTNNELIATLGNFVNRVFSLIKGNFPDGVKTNGINDEFITLTKNCFKHTGVLIDKGNFREGLKLIFQIAEKGNVYLQSHAPWEKIKENRKEAEKILAISGEVIVNLATLIFPYLPESSKRILKMVDSDLPLKWQYYSPEDIKVNDVKPLYKKVNCELL